MGNTTRGDERIAYKLGGTIEEDEKLFFTYNLMNNVAYYNQATGYFYDLTDGVQLTPDAWGTVKAISDATYTPLNAVITYTGTAATAGHEIAIVFREWHNSTSRIAYFDNISVTSQLPGLYLFMITE